MNELVFFVEEAVEGGFTSRALGHSIFTEAETLEQLRLQVRDAVQCHFDEGKAPKVILRDVAAHIEISRKEIANRLLEA